jgi:quinolinate synthase
MVHPECSSETRKVADFIGSTSIMCQYAKASSSKKFIIGTEEGIIHRLKKENPSKEFIIAYDGAVCPNMKITTLERIYVSLKEEKHLIKVPESVAQKARVSLERMFEIKS